MAVIGGRYYSPEEIEEMALSPFDMPPIRQSPIQQSPIQEQVPSGFPRPEPPGAPGIRIESPPPPPAPTAPLEPMDAPPSMPPNISGEPVEGMEDTQFAGSQIQARPQGSEPKGYPGGGVRTGIEAMQIEPVLRDAIIDLMTPSTEMSGRFERAIDAMPQRRPPTKLGRISAMLSGLSTVGHPQREPYAANEIEDALYGPYNRELSDWKLKSEMLKDAANIERQSNASQRVGGTSILGTELGNRRLEAQLDPNTPANRVAQQRADAATTTAEAAKTRAEVQKQKSDVLDLILRGNQIRLDEDRHPYIIVKKADGTGYELKVFDQLTERDLITAKSLADTELQRERAEDAERLARVKGEEQRKTNEAKSKLPPRPGSGGTGSQPTPQNVVNARTNAFNQWVKEWKIANPDWASYVQNPKGVYTGTRPFGPDIPGIGQSRAQYNAKMKEIQDKLEEYRSGKLDSTLRMGGGQQGAQPQDATAQPARPTNLPLARNYSEGTRLRVDGVEYERITSPNTGNPAWRRVQEK